MTLVEIKPSHIILSFEIFGFNFEDYGARNQISYSYWSNIIFTGKVICELISDGLEHVPYLNFD